MIIVNLSELVALNSKTSDPDISVGINLCNIQNCQILSGWTNIADTPKCLL